MLTGSLTRTAGVRESGVCELCRPIGRAQLEWSGSGVALLKDTVMDLMWGVWEGGGVAAGRGELVTFCFPEIQTNRWLNRF